MRDPWEESVGAALSFPPSEHSCTMSWMDFSMNPRKEEKPLEEVLDRGVPQAQTGHLGQLKQESNLTPGEPAVCSVGEKGAEGTGAKP